MKTITQNNIGLNRSYPLPGDIQYHSDTGCPASKSCFYDFGANSSVAFTGYVKKPGSAFVSSIAAMFHT